MFSRALLGRYASPQFSRCSSHKLSDPVLRTNPRFFSRLNRLQAPKKKPVPAATRTNNPPKPSAQPLPVREPPAGARLARFENFVSENNGPVVLFQAPPHKGYIFGAYAVAVFCYAYAGFNFYTVSIDPRVSVGMLEKGLFGGICVVMGAMGTVFLLRGSNLLSSVIARQSKGKTQLDLTVRRMVPFLKPRKFSIEPAQLSCSRQIVVPPKSPNQIAEEAQQATESQKAINHMSFVRTPIKRISYSLWKLFINSRRLFSQEHFVHLKIDGRKGTFRMDTTGEVSKGFLLLNNLVREGYA